jgi:hypothetical protein
MNMICVDYAREYLFLTCVFVRSKQYIASSTSRVNGVMMPKKRSSKEEFEAFLKVLFDNDSLQVKYQHPDAWRLYNRKKSNNAR